MSAASAQSDNVVATLNALLDGPAADRDAAATRLAGAGSEVHAALIDRYRQVVATRPTTAATLRELASIMEVFRAQGEVAAPALPFLLDAADLVDPFREEVLFGEDPEAHAAWNALFSAAIGALGGSGPAGMEELLVRAAAGDANVAGQSVADMLDTIVPTGDRAFSALAAAYLEGEPGRSAFAARLLAGARGTASDPVAGGLRSPTSEVRRRAAALLPRMLPDSIAHLSDAIRHKDVAVRRVAIEGAERGTWPWRMGRGTSDYATAAFWSGYWSDTAREDARERALVAHGEAIFARALADPDADVRMAAALLLYKLGPAANIAEDALRETINDPDPAVSLWSTEALALRAPEARWRRLMKLAEKNADDTANQEIDVSALAARLAIVTPEWAEVPKEYQSKVPPVADDRFNAAVALTTGLTDLLAAARGTGPEAASNTDVLDAMEEAVHQHCAVLAALVIWESVDFYPDPVAAGAPATTEALRLGAAALPELSWELLREPRYPFGEFVYEALARVIQPIAGDALPLLGLAMLHRNSDARIAFEPLVMDLGPRALPLARLLVSTWRDVPPPSGDEWIRHHSSSPVIVAIGAGATPLVAATLEDPHQYARVRAAYTLLAVAPPGTAPALLARARDITEGR